MKTSEKVVNVSGIVAYMVELINGARRICEREDATPEDIARALESIVYRWEPQQLDRIGDLFKHIYNRGWIDPKDES